MSELNIPESWAETSLGSISSSITYGGTASASTSGKFKFLRITDLTDSGVDWDSVPFCKIEKGERYLMDNGDIVIARTGGTVGKSYRIEKPPENAIYASYLIKVSPNKLLKQSKFLSLYLKSPFYWGQIQEKVQGAAQPNVNATKLAEIPVGLPPFEEQERIVQKIESCFEKIDATEANLNKVESLLEKLAISFLTKNGEWLETSPLEELTDERVERIGEENPKCRKIGVDNELGVVDLRVTGKQNFENYKIVKQGDILYNPMRINVGSLALYNDSEDAITSPDYIVFSIRPEFSKWLVFKFLKSSFGAEEISKKLKGAVRERLYYKSLKEIKFPNPKKDTHKQAERIIEAISTNLLSQKQTLLILISKLKESILLKAFEGRLVMQIPSEGTGHELLAKILAKKEKQQNIISEAKTKKISSAKAVSSKGNKNGKK